MAYVTTADLIARFGEEELIQLTSRGVAGMIDADVVSRAIADAEAEIDGYLKAAGYTVPLSPVPPLLVRVASDITRYRLYEDASPEEVRRRYEDARRLLSDIQAGRITLVDAVSAGSDAPDFITPGRIFTHDTLADF